MSLAVPTALRAIATGHADAIAGRLGSLQAGESFTGWQERPLFLCFTNRCGSNFLAQLLASTGAFNEAGEFFNAETVLEHVARARLPNFRAYCRYLPSLVAHRGRLAAKIGIDQLIMLTDAGVLGPMAQKSTFLLLERRDRLGQAISRVIAAQTGHWSSEHRSHHHQEPLYSRAAIELEMRKIETANFAFYRFFAANGIAPVHLAYEAVVADPDAAMAEVGAWLGLDALRPNPAQIRLRPQAGPLNQAWRRRFELA